MSETQPSDTMRAPLSSILDKELTSTRSLRRRKDKITIGSTTRSIAFVSDDRLTGSSAGRTTGVRIESQRIAASREFKSLTGFVRLLGTPPPESPLPLDPSCRTAHTQAGGPQNPTTRFYRVGKDFGLADVIVSLVGDKLRPDPYALTNVLHIEQRGCVFEPYVSACEAGSIIRLSNSDPLLHSAHVTVKTTRSANPLMWTQFPNAPHVDFRLTKPVSFQRIKCDIHPWMFAYVSIFPHPYFAVTDTNGQFHIKEPPIGRYELRAQHRKLGVLSREVFVPSTRAIQFEFESP